MTRSMPSTKFIATIVLGLFAFAAAPAASAGVIIKYFKGEISVSSIFGLPAGTIFVGSYTFDDAIADSNANGQVGDYATDMLSFDFGGGMTAMVAVGATNVRNDTSFFFPGATEDRFQISGAATGGGFATPLIDAALLFSAFNLGGPTPVLTDDTLAGVAHVIGAPWLDNSIQIRVQNGAGPANCQIFNSNPCIATGLLNDLGDRPFSIPEPATLALLGIGLFGLGAARRHRR